jgi:hypothetical protein
MTDIVKTLRFLVSLDQPEKGGPYRGTAAEECVRAMGKAAGEIEELRNIIDNARMAFAETHHDDESRCRAMAAHLSAVDDE